MKKLTLVLASVLFLVGVVVLGGRASAWGYSMSGKGECQPDGSFKITWTVENPESEDLNITASSNAAVVAVGEQIPANDSEDFTQSADGTPATFSLELEGNFPSDQTKRTRSATVTLVNPCDQPPPPVVPPVVPPVTPTPQPVVESKVIEEGK